MIPTELLATLHLALTVVQEHPLHDLPLPYRLLIQGYLGVPFDDWCNVNAPVTAGYKRRVQLSILTAERVLPLWDLSPNVDYHLLQVPLCFLNVAKSILTGTHPRQIGLIEMLYPTIGRIFDKISNDFAYQATKAPFIVSATYTAYATSIFDVCFVPSLIATSELDLKELWNGDVFISSNINWSLTEQDIDYDYWDTAFYAAATYANGPSWISESSSGHRKEFWEWWLTEAVPEAWNSVSDNG